MVTCGVISAVVVVVVRAMSKEDKVAAGDALREALDGRKAPGGMLARRSNTTNLDAITLEADKLHLPRVRRDLV